MSPEKQLPWRVGSTHENALAPAPAHLPRTIIPAARASEKKEKHCDLVRKHWEGESWPSSVGSVPKMEFE